MYCSFAFGFSVSVNQNLKNPVLSQNMFDQKREREN